MGVSSSTVRPLHRAVLLPWQLASSRVSNEREREQQVSEVMLSLTFYSVGHRQTVTQCGTGLHKSINTRGGSWRGHYIGSPLS